MKYVGIGHVGLRVGDMQRERAFYEKDLQLPEVCAVPGEDGQTRIVFYRLPTGQLIELIRAEGGYDGRNVKGVQSHWHNCLEMDARHEAYRDLDCRGIPCRRRADDSVAFDGSWAAFLADPEGNEWELMEFSPISKQIRHLPENMNPKE